MQTDSHMDYVQDWDDLMMKEWAAVSFFMSIHICSVKIYDIRYILCPGLQVM
jgi:hypothetical protein